jgi:hypothetical protein
VCRSATPRCRETTNTRAHRPTTSNRFGSPERRWKNNGIATVPRTRSRVRKRRPHRGRAPIQQPKRCRSRFHRWANCVSAPHGFVLGTEEFCFETNLASKGLVGRIDRLSQNGLHTKMIFVALPDVELAPARVAARVLAGGHDVPEETVRRRFKAGRYLETIYDQQRWEHLKRLSR